MARRQRESLIAVAQASPHIIHSSPFPSTANANPIGVRTADPLALRASEQQTGKINAGVDCQLERSPEAAVDFHYVGSARCIIDFVFDHCHAAPPDSFEQTPRFVEQAFVDADALPINADPTRRRFLAQSPVPEVGNELTIPQKQKNADSGTNDPLLQEEWVRARGKLCQGLEE